MMSDWAQEIAIHARELAAQLREGMHWVPREPGDYGNFWQFDNHQSESRLRARAGRGLELLRTYAGTESQFLVQAAHRLTGTGKSDATGIYELADILDEWANAIDSGLLATPTGRESMRLVAATDLMEQVRLLMDDKRVHPSAPIMLAGAALEELLRSLIESKGLGVDGKPGIQAYSQALRVAGVLSAQQVKDVIQVAGLRNAAAHGEFDELSRERAGLMEQHVNILMSELGTVGTEPQSSKG